jgi:hypothetical protein
MQPERNRCIELLREALKPGDKLYTVLRSVSRSGMSRTIDVYAITCTDGQTDKRCWSYTIATACGDSLDKNGAIKVSGCGTDAGFWIVYNLGRVLFPQGFAVSGDTSGHDADGGYALKQEWI